jgi:hypothetical protein
LAPESCALGGLHVAALLLELKGVHVVFNRLLKVLIDTVPQT